MLKIAESAIKTVKADKRKWLARLNQKVLEVGRVIACGLSWSAHLPVDSRHLTHDRHMGKDRTAGVQLRVEPDQRSGAAAASVAGKCVSR